MRFGLSIIFRIFDVDASGCADELWQFCCTCTVVVLPKDEGRQSLHHYMMSQGSLMLLWEGTIKGDHDQASGLLLLLLLSSRCFDTGI